MMKNNWWQGKTLGAVAGITNKQHKFWGADVMGVNSTM